VTLSKYIIVADKITFIYFMVQHPLMGQGLLIIKSSRSRSDTPHSVGLLLTSDRPVAETSLPDTT